MTAWASMTANQQTQMMAYMASLRPAVARFASAVNALASLDSNWQNIVLAEVTALDAGTVIPDVTGLSGAIPLTREQVLAFMTSAETMLSTYNTATAKTLYAQMAGFVNIAS